MTDWKKEAKESLATAAGLGACELGCVFVATAALCSIAGSLEQLVGLTETALIKKEMLK